MNDAAEPRSVYFTLARLFAAFQLLAAGLLAALCAVTFLTVEQGNRLREIFGLPEFLAAVAAAGVSVGFEYRRCWARTFLLGECLLLPAGAILGCLALQRSQGLDAVLVAPLILVGVGSLVGIFSLNSTDVRNWCR